METVSYSKTPVTHLHATRVLHQKLHATRVLHENLHATRVLHQNLHATRVLHQKRRYALFPPWQLNTTQRTFLLAEDISVILWQRNSAVSLCKSKFFCYVQNKYPYVNEIRKFVNLFTNPNLALFFTASI